MATHFHLPNEKGWSLTGNYRGTTDAKGRSFIKIKTVITSPVFLNIGNEPHLQNWYFPFADEKKIEHWACGADTIDKDGKPEPF